MDYLDCVLTRLKSAMETMTAHSEKMNRGVCVLPVSAPEGAVNNILKTCLFFQIPLQHYKIYKSNHIICCHLVAMLSKLCILHTDTYLQVIVVNNQKFDPVTTVNTTLQILLSAFYVYDYIMLITFPRNFLSCV